jgi:hypothetical protein
MRPYLKNKAKRARGVPQVVLCLPNKPKAPKVQILVLPKKKKSNCDN